MLNRQLLIKIHLIMAAVTLPIVLMFLITGGLYTAEYKPSSSSQTYSITLQSSEKRDVKALKALVSQELAKLGLEVPNGKAKIKRDKKKGGHKFVWSGKNHSVTLKPSSKQPMTAEMVIKTPSLYHRLMRLHKGKGPDVFDIFAITASIVLFLILLSGVVIGLQSRVYKNMTIKALSIGTFVFVAMVIYAQY